MEPDVNEREGRAKWTTAVLHAQPETLAVPAGQRFLREHKTKLVRWRAWTALHQGPAGVEMVANG